MNGIDVNKTREILDYGLEIGRRDFKICDDPVSIPHRFNLKQDIEISAFFSAIFAWGQRKTIIAKGNEFMRMMGDEPYNFITNASGKEMAITFSHFKHRTFTNVDATNLCLGLKNLYNNYDSMEGVFTGFKETDGEYIIEKGLTKLNKLLLLPGSRTQKHLSCPTKKSACKRLNLFLRWMVRTDSMGIDFGIWKEIPPASLICPLDVHVARTATRLGLINPRNLDWAAAGYLTKNLRILDEADPVKYDISLFSLSHYGYLTDLKS